jgi:hypothetical protein
MTCTIFPGNQPEIFIKQSRREGYQQMAVEALEGARSPRPVKVVLSNGMPPLSRLPRVPFRLIIRCDGHWHWLREQDMGFLYEVDLRDIAGQIDLPDETFAPRDMTSFGKMTRNPSRRMRFPPGLRTIGCGCLFATNLSFLDLRRTRVSAIGPMAFCHCSRLRKICFPGTLETIGEDCFRVTAVRIIDLGRCCRLPYIGHCAFAECLKLESVRFSRKKVMLGGSIVWGCDMLTELDLGVVLSLTITRMIGVGRPSWFGCVDGRWTPLSWSW